MKRVTIFLLSALISIAASAGSSWEIDSSTLTYHASHPMHHSMGLTFSSKGKGVCKEDGCDFLIGVPVNTFQSGDSNRDLHMVQAVHGGENPMILVRTHLAKEPAAPGFKADLSVNFGGKEVLYRDVAFNAAETSPGHMHVQGTLNLILTQHNVNRPSLLGVPIKDEVPVEIDVVWLRK